MSKLDELKKDPRYGDFRAFIDEVVRESLESSTADAKKKEPSGKKDADTAADDGDKNKKKNFFDIIFGD